MEERICEFKAWISRHKKELIATGIGVATLLLVITGLHHRDELEACWKMCKARIAKRKALKVPVQASRSIPAGTHNVAPARIPVMDVPHPVSVEIVVPAACCSAEEVGPIAKALPIEPFGVNSHFRHLPNGQNPSALKIAQAVEQGIELPPGCTLVDSYVKYASAP